MKRTHQLIKLRIETVQYLKSLKTEMGIGGLDELVNIMIQVTDEHSQVLGDTGWNIRGEVGEV